MFICEDLIREFVMTICEFDEWVVIVGEGAIGVCVWFGAPIRHYMPGWSLARH